MNEESEMKIVDYKEEIKKMLDKPENPKQLRTVSSEGLYLLSIKY